MCIQQTNLDAFWSYKPGTVSANLSEARKLEDSNPFKVGMNISEAYGVSRLLCRGSTMEAGNCGCPPHVIEVNNCWRKVEPA